VSEIAAGANHSCVLTAEGRGQCWGRGEQGQLGRRPFPKVDDADLNLGRWNGQQVPLHQVVLGSNHGCARLPEDVVKCWGANSAGQLGVSHREPVGLGPMGENVKAVVEKEGVSFGDICAAGDNTCGVSLTGEVWCWGAGIGDGSPTNVGLPWPVSKIRCGEQHWCAILPEGHAVCWGSGADGRLGSGDTATRAAKRAAVPVPLHGLNVTDIALGRCHTCAVTVAGRLVCFGCNSRGQLGLADTVTRGTENWMSKVALGRCTVVMGRTEESDTIPPLRVEETDDGQQQECDVETTVTTEREVFEKETTKTVVCVRGSPCEEKQP